MKFITYLFACIAFSQSSLAATDAQVEEFNETYRAYSAAVEEAYAFDGYLPVLPLAQRLVELGVELELSTEELATLHYNLAEAQYHTSKNAGATDSIEKSLAATEKLFGNNSEHLIPILLLKTKIEHHIKGHRSRSPQRTMRRAISISEKAYGKMSVTHAGTLLSAVDLWMKKGDRCKITFYLDKAIEIYETTGRVELPSYGSALFRRAKLNLALKKEEKSVSDLNKAISNFDGNLEPSHPVVLSAHQFLVEAYEKLDMEEEANKHCQHIGMIDPEEGDGEPVPIYRKMMRYPMNALEKGIEGWVVVNFTIDENGQVREPKVVKGKRRSTFSSSALSAISEWRFRPGFEDGKFVERADQHIRMVYEMAD